MIINNIQMKKNIFLNKYIGIVILFIGVFCISHSASANTYTHTCDDGGTVTSVVSITPTGPFLMYYNSNFTAIGYVSSTCSARFIKLTAQNLNNTSNPTATLFPETWVTPTSQFPMPAATTAFQSPAGTPATLSVHFVTGVNEPSPVSPPILHFGLSYPERYNQNDIPVFNNVYPWNPPGNAGGKLIVKVNGVTICDTSDPVTGVGYETTDCGSTFYNALEGDVVTVTAQAYQNYYPGNYEIRTITVNNTGSLLYSYNHSDHYSGYPKCGYSNSGAYYNDTGGDPNGYCNLQTLTFTAYNNGQYQIGADFIGTGI